MKITLAITTALAVTSAVTAQGALRATTESRLLEVRFLYHNVTYDILNLHDEIYSLQSI